LTFLFLLYGLLHERQTIESTVLVKGELLNTDEVIPQHNINTETISKLNIRNKCLVPGKGSS